MEMFFQLDQEFKKDFFNQMSYELNIDKYLETTNIPNFIYN
jgi:hypothetical protein